MSSSAHIRAARNQILYRYLIHKIKIDQFNLCEAIHDNLIECENLIAFSFLAWLKRNFHKKHKCLFPIDGGQGVMIAWVQYTYLRGSKLTNYSIA